MILNRNTRFKCTCCGLCCKLVAPKILPAEYIDPETGWCKYLDPETNLCTIYDSRPLVCRVDELWDTFGESLGYKNKKEWQEGNYEQCKKLIEENE